MFHKRIIRAATVGLALGAVSAPVAGAQPRDWPINPPEHSAKVVDLRSPDARDAAAKGAVKGASRVDLRSPDARDAAANAAVKGVSRVDLRSPDARDAAANAAAKAAAPVDLHLRRSAPVSATTHSVPAASHKSDGTDWKDVGIIGGSGLSVLLTGFGVAYATRRKSAARKARTPALTR